ncbi:hypothetical protein, partial [Methylobacterium sp. WL116]|uniref:hypothetical protein n=1 Tax=Methylobacterium sp. WL116 TaxID=2603889 RepID=UPI001FED5455
MRRLLKFLHTMGAVGLMGALACLLVLLAFVPPPADRAGYALMRGAMGAVATWIFLPALALTLLAGLLAMAQRAFHRAAWAWAKLATGVLMFEGGLVYVQGPMRQEADLSAAALAGRDTLFARIQQFAVRLYAPLALRCLETWQGPDGSYWGHN